MRILIDPPLKMAFNDVYMAIKSQPNSFSPDLKTTGGVIFAAEAALTRDGRRFISLPHNNRIYENDWGYRSNSMGKDGQRIAHYSIPLDEWAFHKKNVRKTTVQDDCLSLYEPEDGCFSVPLHRLKEFESRKIEGSGTEHAFEHYREYTIKWIFVPSFKLKSHNGEHRLNSRHGIELYYKKEEPENIVGFIEGYEWYHNKGGPCRIYVLSRNSKDWGNLLSKSEMITGQIKESVYEILLNKKLVGLIRGDIYANANA